MAANANATIMTGHGCRVQNATVRTTAEASIPVESPPRQPQVRSGYSDQGGLTFSNVPEPESLRKPLSGCPVSCRDGAPFRINVPSAVTQVGERLDRATGNLPAVATITTASG